MLARNSSNKFFLQNVVKQLTIIPYLLTISLNRLLLATKHFRMVFRTGQTGLNVGMVVSMTGKFRDKLVYGQNKRN